MKTRSNPGDHSWQQMRPFPTVVQRRAEPGNKPEARGSAEETQMTPLESTQDQPKIDPKSSQSQPRLHPESSRNQARNNPDPLGNLCGSPPGDAPRGSTRGTTPQDPPVTPRDPPEVPERYLRTFEYSASAERRASGRLHQATAREQNDPRNGARGSAWRLACVRATRVVGVGVGPG